MTYGDALRFVIRLAASEDPRFQKAAGRWFGRYIVATDAKLGDAELVLNLLRGLRGANALLLERRLFERVAASGLADVQMSYGREGLRSGGDRGRGDRQRPAGRAR